MSPGPRSEGTGSRTTSVSRCCPWIVAGVTREQQACEGMLEFVIGKLGELDRFQKQGGIAVVPALEIRQGAPLTADAVRARFAATLAVAVTADWRATASTTSSA